MKKYIVVLSFLLVGSFASAQDSYFYLTYNANKPTANGWLESSSSRGWHLGYQGFLRNFERLSIGLDVHWTQFDQYQPYETFPNSSGATSTDYFKYIYQYGGALTSRYYFPLGDRELFFPYAGLGLGATYNEYLLYYNVFTEGEDRWGFLARPEAGILARFREGGSLGVIASVHYDFSTNSSPSFEVSNFSALGFQIGLLLMDR
jgi:hypothetical protein